MARTAQETPDLAPPFFVDEPQIPIKYMETVDAYNKWAEVYDTDDNFLQALDTIEMHHLLPLFLDKVTGSIQLPQNNCIKLVDLGCGTGRNTLQLLNAAPSEVKVVGLDASPGMLAVARKVLQKQPGGTKVQLNTFDMVQCPAAPPECSFGAAGVISTLVLEHIPVDKFFERAAEILRPGGYLLVTNMHSDMGKVSQAGFVDVETGTKVRPRSYAHTVPDMLGAAERAGFEVEALDGEEVREKGVDETMVERLGPRSKKWVGVMVWFGVCFRKRGC